MSKPSKSTDFDVDSDDSSSGGYPTPHRESTGVTELDLSPPSSGLKNDTMLPHDPAVVTAVAKATKKASKHYDASPAPKGPQINVDIDDAAEMDLEAARLKSELAALATENAAYRGDVVRLTAELATARNSNVRLAEQNEQMSKAMGTQHEKDVLTRKGSGGGGFFSRAKHVDPEVAAHDEKLSKVIEANGSLAHELAVKTKALSELQKQHDDYVVSHHTANTDVALTQKMLRSTEAEKMALMQSHAIQRRMSQPATPPATTPRAADESLVKLQKEFARYKETYTVTGEQLASVVATKDAQVQELVNEIESLTNVVSFHEASLTEKQEEIVEAAEAVRQLEEQLQEAQSVAALATTKERKSSLSDESLQRSLNEETKKGQALQDKANALALEAKKRVDALNHQLEETETILREEVSTNEILRGRLEDALLKVEACAEAEEKIDELTKRIVTMDAIIEAGRLNNSAVDSTEELAALRVLLEEDQASLRGQKAINKALEGKLLTATVQSAEDKDEIGELKKHILTMQAIVEAERQDSSEGDSTEELAALRLRLEEAQTSLIDQGAINKVLEEKLEAATVLSADDEEEIGELKARIEKLEASIDVGITKNTGKDEEIKALKGRAAALDGHYAGDGQTVRDLEAALLAATKASGDADEGVALVRQVVAGLRKDADQLSTLCSEKEDEIGLLQARLHERLHEANGDVVHMLEARILQLEAQVSETKPTVDSSDDDAPTKEQVSELQEKFIALEEERDTLQFRVNELEKNGAGKKKEPADDSSEEDDGSERIATLEAAMVDYETKITAKDEQIAVLRRTLKKFESQPKKEVEEKKEPVKAVEPTKVEEAAPPKGPEISSLSNMASKKADEELADYMVMVEDLKSQIRKGEKELSKYAESVKEYDRIVKDMGPLKTELVEHKALVDRLGLSYPFPERLIGSARMKIGRFQEL